MRVQTKEALVKILKRKPPHTTWNPEKAIEEMADYLLDNNIAVLPCKVGDTVYQVIGHYDYIRQREVVGYHLGEFEDLRGHKRKSYLICCSTSSPYLSRLDIDKIGKTVFLTREDAEAALDSSKCSIE